MESSPRSAGPRLQPAHHVQMRPVAPRLQVSNFQFTEGNAACTYGAPALNRGFSANPALVPFEANVSALPLLNTRAYLSAHTTSSITVFGTNACSVSPPISPSSMFFHRLPVLHASMAKAEYVLTRSFLIEPQQLSSPPADNAGVSNATQRIHPLGTRHALTRPSRSRPRGNGSGINLPPS